MSGAPEIPQRGQRTTTALRMGPVKCIVAVLHGPDSPLASVLTDVTNLLGPVDFASRPSPFDMTGYYGPEMGEGLLRIILGFERLIPPEDILRIKLAANAIEDRWRQAGKRPVNLDPGYIDYFKLVLASNKPGGNKVAIGQGVWLDINLLFEHGAWKTLPWTFPDFKTGRYDKDLLTIRTRYKAQMRALDLPPDA